MDDILHGGRDDLRSYRGRVGFTFFARIFTGCFLCVVFLVVGFLVLFLFVVSASLPLKGLLQAIPVSHFSLSHISRVDRPCPVLARQCRKKKATMLLN